jgi:hypothetical protein
MLDTISWQQYVTAVCLLTAAWYIYVGLTHYQNELAAFFKIKPAIKNQLPPVESKTSISVMGLAQAQTGTGLFNPDELIIGQGEPDDITDATLPKGPADNLLAEAELLVTAFETSNDKSGFLSLLNLLIEKYDIFHDEISLPAVIANVQAFAANKLSFQIPASEWPLNFAS